LPLPLSLSLWSDPWLRDDDDCSRLLLPASGETRLRRPWLPGNSMQQADRGENFTRKACQSGGGVALRSWCAPCSLLLLLLIWVEDVRVQYYQSPSRVPQFDKPLNACCHAMLPRGRRVVCGGWAMVGFRAGTSVAFGRGSEGEEGGGVVVFGGWGGRGVEWCRGHVLCPDRLSYSEEAYIRRAVLHRRTKSRRILPFL